MDHDINQILIGIPAYNEGSEISGLIEKLLELGYEQIVVVDDGSTDQTYDEASKYPIKLLRHVINCGVGTATQTLIDYARQNHAQYLLIMDADNQHEPKNINSLYLHMEGHQSDIVIGNRFSKSLDNQIPRKKRFFNQLANAMTNAFCKGRYRDTQSGFRLLNKRAIHAIQLEATGFGFCSEMILVAEKAGLKISECPINVYYTEYSQSKGQTNLMSGIRTAWQFLENI